MANDGYFVGSVCSDLRAKSISTCLSWSPQSEIAIPNFRFKQSSDILYCWSPSSNAIFPLPVADCQISSSSSAIPTVADGITLGWQAGGALILVGCILFIKKALK